MVKRSLSIKGQTEQFAERFRIERKDIFITQKKDSSITDWLETREDLN